MIIATMWLASESNVMAETEEVIQVSLGLPRFRRWESTNATTFRISIAGGGIGMPAGVSSVEELVDAIDKSGRPGLPVRVTIMPHPDNKGWVEELNGRETEERHKITAVEVGARGAELKDLVAKYLDARAAIKEVLSDIEVDQRLSGLELQLRSMDPGSPAKNVSATLQKKKVDLVEGFVDDDTVDQINLLEEYRLKLEELEAGLIDDYETLVESTGMLGEFFKVDPTETKKAIKAQLVKAGLVPALADAVANSVKATASKSFEAARSSSVPGAGRARYMGSR